MCLGLKCCGWQNFCCILDFNKCLVPYMVTTSFVETLAGIVCCVFYAQGYDNMYTLYFGVAGTFKVVSLAAWLYQCRSQKNKLQTRYALVHLCAVVLGNWIAYLAILSRVVRNKCTYTVYDTVCSNDNEARNVAIFVVVPVVMSMVGWYHSMALKWRADQAKPELLF